MVKKVFPWIIFVLLFGVLIIGFSLKDKMNNYLSEMMKQQASPEITLSGNAVVDSLYNYSENGLNYEITFLEFGATGCSACKRMESVLEEINSKYPKTNVVFLNVLKPENQNLMKLFGIASIPTQVLLNNKAKEFFRHSGYISTAEIENTFQNY
jgi:thioredoxin 1